MNKYKYKLKETSATGGGVAGASFNPGTGEQYSSPFAFNSNKKAKGEASKYYYKLGYKLAPNQVSELNIGATLGPGPKASKEGVKDNYYVKGFKFKLVPKKIKGSGLEVKQLFEKNVEELNPNQKFQKERINAFDSIRDELNNIYKMISNSKNKTIEYYKNNPESYTVITPTDLILDYLKDIKDLLK